MDTMLDLKQWVTKFVDAYRFEASLLRDQDIFCLWPFVKEQMLAKPCSIEILEFRNPYRLLLVFFFGKDLEDWSIHLTKCFWSQISKITSKFIGMYPSVDLDRKELCRSIARTRRSPRLIYGMDCDKNFRVFYFTEDVRFVALPYCDLEEGSAPEGVAKTVFHLNHKQAQDIRMGCVIRKIDD